MSLWVAVRERLAEFSPQLSPDMLERMLQAGRCAELLEVCRAVDLRKIPITQEQREDAEAVYAGNAEYVLPNGWTLWVFNDCDEWDYLDSARAPDGWAVQYRDMPEWLQDWAPEPITADSIWGISP
jgi:hypothetical protein